MKVINKLLICPACDNDNLNKLDYKLICINCDREYMIRDNIPLMFFQTDWNNAKYDVTKMVKQFYEKSPQNERVAMIPNLVSGLVNTFFS